MGREVEGKTVFELYHMRIKSIFNERIKITEAMWEGRQILNV